MKSDVDDENCNMQNSRNSLHIEISRGRFIAQLGLFPAQKTMHTDTPDWSGTNWCVFMFIIPTSLSYTPTPSPRLSVISALRNLDLWTDAQVQHVDLRR